MVTGDLPGSGSPPSAQDAPAGVRSPAKAGAAEFQSILFEHPAGDVDGLTALFLRAEREPDGRRTFKVLAGGPLPTSYGEDSYRRIFGPASAAPAAVSTNR